MSIKKEISEHEKRYDQFVANHKVDEDHFRQAHQQQVETMGAT